MIYYLCLVLLLLFYEIDFLLNFKYRYKWLYILTKYINHISIFKGKKIGKPAILSGVSNGMLILLFWSYAFVAFIIYSMFFLTANLFYVCIPTMLITNFLKSYLVNYDIKYFKVASLLEAVINIIIFGFIFFKFYSPIFLNLIN